MNVMRRLLTGAALAATALTLVGCSSPDAPALSKAQQVRQSIPADANPATQKTDEQIDRVGKADCDLLKTWNGNQTILQTLAERSPIPGYSTWQALDFHLNTVKVYCPEIVKG